MTKKNCEICGSEFKTYVKPSRPERATRTCSKECLKKLKSKIFSGKGNPAYGRTYRTKETHPEWAAKVSKTSKERKINSGEKNGMKKPEFRKKASISAKKKFENQEMRDLISRGVARAWARGDFDGVRVGQCSWHDYEKKDGQTIKCQGLWELEFARYLDENDIKFDAHVGRIPYVDDDGNERSYYPDFYFIEEDKYVDVKNPYYETAHASKIEAVKRDNPNIELEVYGWKKLAELNIPLSGFSEGRFDVI